MDLLQKPQTSLESDTQKMLPGTDKLNLQKELVSQEKVIDERLMSVEHKNDEWKNSRASLIPSTVQCLIDAERLLFEQQYTVQLGGDILNDAEHAKKQRPDISTEWSGTDKLNLQKELVSQEKVIDDRLMSVEHKNNEWKNSPGSLIPSTVQCLIDADRLLFEQQHTVQLGGDILNDGEHVNTQRPDISTVFSDAEHSNTQRSDISTVFSSIFGYDPTEISFLIDDADDADDKPVGWAPPAPPPPPDPPNPDT
ncbi:uncharacterized protein LOC143083572 [Mytilus galloprovincialis]|uniref:uncharacterized protein LOC143083572 n=1 Tax=Mytilus galloprovincialis TaxID=29158 RepID=UPI003F7C407E